MADTTAAPNNKPVAFGVKNPVREPAGVANAAPVKKLSRRGAKKARSAIKRGLISEKAAKRLLGDG